VRMRFEGGGSILQPCRICEVTVIQELVHPNFVKELKRELIWYAWRVYVSSVQ
jgi:hypothetical protein